MAMVSSTSAAGSDVSPGVVSLRLQDVHVGPSLRDKGVNMEHVRSLAGLEGGWPPILLSSRDSRIVDGLHRFHAAKSLGYKRIACRFFCGDRDEEYLEFVRRNSIHGLPLTPRDRERAARCLLGSHENWSDRRIAEACGMSAGTVARLRGEMRLDDSSNSSTLNGLSPRRIGKDGRARPVDGSATRDRIAAALRDNPSGSLRSIAAIAGASPETVRSVRADLSQHQTVAFEAADATVSPLSVAVRLLEPSTSSNADRVREEWSGDSALRSTPQGQLFIDWLSHNDIADDWRDQVHLIPLSRVYEVANEARRRAASWSAFAEALESQVSAKRARGA